MLCFSCIPSGALRHGTCNISVKNRYRTTLDKITGTIKALTLKLDFMNLGTLLYLDSKLVAMATMYMGVTNESG